MEDFQSKYSGEQVEEMLDQIANGEAGGGGGGIAVETDPVFSASPAASITEEKKAEWDNKVDKVSGKQLSTEDFTSALKTKLEGLSNYDDTELSEALSTLRGDFDKLVSGDTTTAIKTFNEVIAFLDGVQDTQDLSGIIASIEQQIAGKMDKVTLATVATTGSYNDLKDKPNFDANVYVWNWGGEQTGLITQEEYNSITNSDYIIVRSTDEEGITSGAIFQLIKYTDCVDAINHTVIGGLATELVIRFTNNLLYSITTMAPYVIPVNTSQLNNDSNFVSSTNLKTINGESIVGSGNISINGGNGSTNGIAMKVEYITPTNSSIAFMGTEQRPSMKANTIYVQQAGSSHTETLDELDIGSFEETTEAYAEYVIIFVFNSPLWGATISLPSYVKWANGTPTEVEPEVVYELNISRSTLAGEATYCAVLTPFKPVE
jgi:hypothetical protein